MLTLNQQYRSVLIFLCVVIIAGSGYWLLRYFHPSLFLGPPDLVVKAAGILSIHDTTVAKILKARGVVPPFFPTKKKNSTI